MIPSSEMASFLASLKEHLNITTGRHDGELVKTLEAAFEVGESVAGVRMYPGTATEMLDGAGVLRHRPVTALTAATYGAENVLGITTSTAAGVVRGYVGTFVTYGYGQTAPTAAQRKGVLLIAAHAWETQRGQATGPLQDTDDASFAPGYGFAVPNRARDYLRPPRGESGIA